MRRLGVISSALLGVLAVQGLSGCAADVPDQPTATTFQPSAPRSSASPSGSDPEPVSITSDGSYRVGLDIRPGTYVMSAQGQVVNDCYWERARSDGAVIANNFAGAATRIVVTIQPSDGIFTTSGCGPWTLQGAADPPGNPAFAEFCEQAAKFSNLGEEISTSPIEQLPALLRQAAQAFDLVEAPEAIAESWRTVGDAAQRFAEAASSVDLTTETGSQLLADAAQEFLAVASGPDGSAVQAFGDSNC